MPNKMTDMNSIKEKIAILQGITNDSPMKKELNSIRKDISQIEQILFAQKSLEEIFNSKDAKSLLIESQAHKLSQTLKNYEKLQSFYVKMIDSLSSIYKTSTQENIGSIRQNLLLSKIRKQFVTLEKKRIPTESMLVELQDLFCSIKEELNKDFTEILSSALKVKKALNRKLKDIAALEQEERDLSSKAQKYSALMDFVASNGSAPFDECEPSASNFQKLTSKLVREFSA